MVLFTIFFIQYIYNVIISMFSKLTCMTHDGLRTENLVLQVRLLVHLILFKVIFKSGSM